MSLLYYKQYILNYTSYNLVTDIYILIEGKLSCLVTVSIYNFLCLDDDLQSAHLPYSIWTHSSSASCKYTELTMQLPRVLICSSSDSTNHSFLNLNLFLAKSFLSTYEFYLSEISLNWNFWKDCALYTQSQDFPWITCQQFSFQSVSSSNLCRPPCLLTHQTSFA